MTTRTYLRAGEVPTLYGENSRQSDYQLWNEMMAGEERDMSEGGIWKGRLATEIMKGICDDHALKNQAALNPREAAADTGVMPSKAWTIAPSMRTEGKDAVLIVDIRASTTMREWHAPDKMPAKAFLQSVIEGDEPDLDFDRDARQIRSGAAVQKVSASAEQVDQLSVERVELVKKLIPAKGLVGQYEGRLSQIDTMFIAMAGTKEKLETPAYVVDITRDAKGTPKVTVVKKGQSLF